MSRFRLAFVAIVLMAGCTITDTSQVNAGKDLKQLSDAYEKMNAMERGKASIKFVAKEADLDFSSPNVEQVPGPAAFQRIFGSTTFQGAMSDPKNAETLLTEMQQFKAFFIPFRDINTYIDRYYFTTKNTLRQGDDLLIIVMFKNDTLFYCDWKYVKVDTKESTSAFAQGILEALKEYLGPASALYDLTDKLKKQFDKSGSIK